MKSLSYDTAAEFDRCHKTISYWEQRALLAEAEVRIWESDYKALIRKYLTLEEEYHKRGLNGRGE